MLLPCVDRGRRRSWIQIALGITIVILAGIVVIDRVDHRTYDGEPDPDRVNVRMYSIRERVLTWTLTHPDRDGACPRARELDAEDPYAALDSWGREVTIACDADGFVLVRSLGRDGVAGTDDDKVSR